MFCPKCATQNIDGAHYCRVCGANVSLIPQALSGELPAAPREMDRRAWRKLRRRSQPSIDEGIRNLVMGVGFVAVALALARFGAPIGASVWWFWMLIPAFGLLGRGIAEIVRVKQSNTAAPPSQELPYSAPAQQLPANPTAELRPSVPSVTEGTTRHLGAEAPTRQIDPWGNQKPS